MDAEMGERARTVIGWRNVERGGRVEDKVSTNPFLSSAFKAAAVRQGLMQRTNQNSKFKKKKK
jgi:hypothetical protein